MSDLEREYSPSSRVGGSAAPFVADYQVRSGAASSMLGTEVVCLAGGSVLVEREPQAPLLIYVHGGYWQALSAAESLFLAPGALAAGWSFAALEYTIAPAGRLPLMIDECRRALASLVGVTGATRVVLAGHSAGAHLAAMCALTASEPIPVDRVVLVSGVFDLRPLVHTSVNAPLALSTAEAAELSPMLRPITARPSTVVAVGDNETDAFKEQSRRFARHLTDAGVLVSSVECAPRHHFDIVDDLVDPSSELGRLTLGENG